MDFSLDIGELTATIREYGNTIKDLEEQKENINKAIKELTDQGWSGEAKDKFMENHIKKQEFYTNLIEKMKYTKNALESQEKPRAIQLKKRSENFEACIKRSGGGVALTNDDSGIISLQYGGQFPINNNIDECTNDYYRNMNSKFVEILSLVNSLSFTTFPIAGDVLNLQNSLRNQTESLTDFKASFNEYCNSVRDMEDNICSVFSKISGITEGISQIRGMSIISENGQVDKDKVIELMLKNPSGLTNEEKEMLSYLEKVLGEKKYAELKEQAIKEEKDLAQLMNLTGSYGPSSIAYIIDPETGSVISLQNVDKKTLHRINYLADKLNWLKENELSDDEGSWMFWKVYSRQYFEGELAKTLSEIKSGEYAKKQEIKDRVYMGLDGTLEFIGGYTETDLGFTVATGGAALTEGLAAPIAIPAGGYLMADGSSAMTEGGTKVVNALTGKKFNTINPLRDWVYKKSFGDENGEMYYNRASLICGGICIAGDVQSISKIIGEDSIKVVPRPQNIAKAERLKLPIETITTKTINGTTKKTVDTIQVIDQSTKTPMILQRTITEHPLLNTWDFTKNSFYTGVDLRNTKGTAQSVQSSLLPNED
ncbi:WXG100 family type VII secretion target [Clostridium sp. P21]|uniref:WXG100 family type VII secretion target n=1 Tax=Clostridium muellerianum TaxID=2716538 RepID=A0A7Y0HQ95_9CLOT|nr:hypothetical protein [Clostridium muellerianum]NMM64502.1 WXG100 family type VII secretion target [Clostridium muellerianum]